MIDRLRSDGGVGLVTANGWYATKHSMGIYSTTPPATPFRSAKPQTELNATPQTKLVDEYDGAATVETFVVMHERDGSPAMGTIAVKTAEGGRTWATTTDAEDDGVARVRRAALSARQSRSRTARSVDSDCAGAHDAQRVAGCVDNRRRLTASNTTVEHGHRTQRRGHLRGGGARRLAVLVRARR